MAKVKTRAVTADRRALIQAAKVAIVDVFDAITELVTNADDRYQILQSEGRIDIEVERRRGDTRGILRVRDWADGMDSETMERKLSIIGGRESGLSTGEAVRGTHSRGAKDVAAIGRVTFESIASDGRYHKCEITPFFEFSLHESEDVTPDIRSALGIAEGTGTVVSIELDKSQRVAQHDNMRERVRQLVSLRGVLGDERRAVYLIDAAKNREDLLRAPVVVGHERVKETLQIAGYPGVKAKLIIFRAKNRFDKQPNRFRIGGILIESKRAIHEATLFDSALESDPHALWFYGRLVCTYIDELCNEFDERLEKKLPAEESNPTYPLDPSRRSGLNREHPFVRALFGEALKKLRPLVDEERRREECEKARMESHATRKRLNALEKAALEFMRDFGEDDEPARDPDGRSSESRFMERGYALIPPFTQMIAGHSRHFWINIHQETFPELEVGSNVHVQCLSDELETSKVYCGLEPHPTREGVLRAVWKITAAKATQASGVRARVGSITAESIVEVLESEADRYKGITAFCFSKKRYSMRTDKKRKKIRVLAPISRVTQPTPFSVDADSRHFELSGHALLQPRPDLGVSLCDLHLKCDGTEADATLTATMGEVEAKATVFSHKPLGVDLSIKLEDIDLGNQRYRWRQNVLEIAGRHASLRRYLGDKENGFPGQESKHFRVLVAEVVSDAVCALLVRRDVQVIPEEYEDADWDAYYAQYCKYMTRFLPIAHKLQCPENQ